MLAENGSAGGVDEIPVVDIPRIGEIELNDLFAVLFVGALVLGRENFDSGQAMLVDL